MYGMLLFGKTKVEILCAYPEKFFSLCSENGVSFHDAKIRDGKIEMYVPYGSERKLRTLEEKSGFSMTSERGKGGGFSLERMRKHIIIIALLFAVTAAASVSTLFIWDFEVYGNENVSRETIMNELNALGVDIGTFRYSVNSERLAREMLYELPELKWFAINMNGSRAEVLVEERDAIPQVYDMDEPVMVYAEKTGVVTKATVLSGNAMCSRGDAVREGDVLISGIMLSETADPRIVRALGDIIAETEYVFSANMPLYTTKIEKFENKSVKFSIAFCRKNINILFNNRILRSNYVTIDKTYKISFPSGGSLPLSFTVRTFNPVNMTKTAISEEEAKQRLEKELIARLGEMTDGEIISTELSYQRNGDVLTGTVHAVCEESISSERPFTEKELLAFTEETEKLNG